MVVVELLAAPPRVSVVVPEPEPMATVVAELAAPAVATFTVCVEFAAVTALPTLIVLDTVLLPIVSVPTVPPAAVPTLIVTAPLFPVVVATPDVMVTAPLFCPVIAADCTVIVPLAAPLPAAELTVSAPPAVAAVVEVFT